MSHFNTEQYLPIKKNHYFFKSAQNKSMKKKKSKFVDKNDPLGSYTGTPLDGEKPVQDADDL